MEKTALILVDLQNDYFPSFKGAKFPLNDCEQSSSNASKILEGFRKKSLDIIHIRHEIDSSEAPFFEKATLGANIHESVKPLEGEIVITKNFPNSFMKTNLKEVLDDLGISSLVVVGAMTHMCVDATVRDAKDFGYNCTVINDACATKDLEFDGLQIPSKYVHGSLMAAFEFAYAEVKNTNEFLEGIDYK